MFIPVDRLIPADKSVFSGTLAYDLRLHMLNNRQIQESRKVVRIAIQIFKFRFTSALEPNGLHANTSTLCVAERASGRFGSSGVMLPPSSPAGDPLQSPFPRRHRPRPRRYFCSPNPFSPRKLFPFLEPLAGFQWTMRRPSFPLLMAIKS